MQVRWSGIPIFLRIFPWSSVIHSVKGFGIASKAEVDVFLELSCFLCVCLCVCVELSCFLMIQCILAILSLVLPFLNPAWISGSSQFIHCCEPGLENFDYYFASVWDECNCAGVWTSFGIAFLWNWNENWLVPVLWPLLFAICSK